MTKTEIIEAFVNLKGASIGSQLAAPDGQLCVVTRVDGLTGHIADVEILKPPTVGQSFEPQSVTVMPFVPTRPGRQRRDRWFAGSMT